MAKYEVIYESETRNMGKVAQVVADELGVKPENIETKEKPEDDSVIFLGACCHARHPGAKVRWLIEKNNLQGRKVAIFGTSEKARGDELAALEKMLLSRGADIIGRYCCLAGSALSYNRRSPSGDTMLDIRKWVRQMKEALQKT